MTGVIWYGRYSNYFSYKPDKFLKRKNVCVKGNISDYEGRTQMEIRTENKLKSENNLTYCKSQYSMKLCSFG